MAMIVSTAFNLLDVMVQVGVFSSLDGDEYANFLKVADAQRSSFVFAHTADASFVPDDGVPLKTPSIRFYKNFDDKIADYTVDFDPIHLLHLHDGSSANIRTSVFWPTKLWTP